jgi:hypothetical protein
MIANRRTPSIENIASYREGLLSAPLERGMRSHYRSKCKQTADSVRHMIRYNSYKTIQLGFPFCGGKQDSLRAIATTAHIAVSVGSCDRPLDKIVAADCESSWLEHMMQRSIESDTYSIAHRIRLRPV